MNLRDLHYLVTLARLKHFGQAAKFCHVSQPTLSLQLKKLEDTLGVTLFERDNKSVHLTEIGQKVVEAAHRVLAEAEQLKQLARAAQNPLAGELRLGAFPTLAPYLFPLIVPEVRKQLPEVTLNLVEEKTDHLLQQLKQGALDAAFIALPLEEKALAYEVVFAEEFWLAVGHDHPLAQRKKVKLSELGQEKILLLDEGHCLRAQTLDVCAKIGVGETGQYRATSLETLRNMVAGGAGVTFLPKLALRPGETLVHYLPLVAPAPSRVVALCWRKNSPRAEVFSRLAALSRQSVLPRL